MGKTPGQINWEKTVLNRALEEAAKNDTLDSSQYLLDRIAKLDRDRDREHLQAQKEIATLNLQLTQMGQAISGDIKSLRQQTNLLTAAESYLAERIEALEALTATEQEHTLADAIQTILEMNEEAKRDRARIKKLEQQVAALTNHQA